jgi:CHAT domain-containing protein
MVLLAGVALLLGSSPALPVLAPHACQRVAEEGAGIQTAADRPRFVRALDECRAEGLQEPALRLAHALFESHWGATEYREALAYSELALALADELEHVAWQRTVLQAVFVLRFSIGDLTGAEAALRRTHALVDREDADQWAYLRLYEATIRKHQGELAGAVSAYRDVLDAAPLGHPTRSDARFELIELYVALGRVPEAEQQLEAVLEGRDAPRPDRLTYQLAKAYHHAEVAEAKGDLATAESSLRAALDADLPRDWEWLLYDRLGRVLEARGGHVEASAAYERAIATVEAMRASFEEEELQEWLLARKREPYESLFVLHVEHGELHLALQTMERARARAFLDAFIRATSPGKHSEAQPLDAVLRAEALPGLVRQLERSPVVALRPIDDLLAAVEGHHVLMYFWAKRRLWLVTLRDGEPTLTALPLTHDELERQLTRLLADPDDETVAAALGRALVPAEVLPARGRPLHVVTDGLLGELPFGALLVDGHPLVLDHAIAHVPSLNVLAAWSQQRAPASGPAVVLGDPQGDLPSAAMEVTEVAALLGAVPRRGTEARIEVLREARRASVLHVATHAGHDALGPWLALADGRAHTDAILEMEASPELVVLATCQSASRPGDTMWGSLGAAFLAAGSQAVLATLWSVDDALTRRFVLRFYREGGATAPVEALARTQRAFAAEGEPASVWAPFVVLGASRIVGDTRALAE